MTSGHYCSWAATIPLIGIKRLRAALQQSVDAGLASSKPAALLHMHSRLVRLRSQFFLQACEPLFQVRTFKGFQKGARHVGERTCNPRIQPFCSQIDHGLGQEVLDVFWR